MFVRKKPNKSGAVSVQIVDKPYGKYKVLQTIGSAKDPDKIEQLVHRGTSLIQSNFGTQQRLLGIKTTEDHAIENFLNNLKNTQIHTIGPELIFGAIFDRIGFSLPDEMFRHLVIARLAYPTSKLKTVDYLYRYCGVHISEDSVYRYLDKLNKQYKAEVEKVAYDYTKQVLGCTISVVFYDMTTLYFEAEDEDDLRIRPIYHYRKRRIEAHICIAFVAYTIYKEVERLLAKQNIQMSGKRAAELTHNMYQLEYTLQQWQDSEKVILQMDAEQKLLYGAIHE